MFPGMPMGALHVGPEAPGPGMTAPIAAPAANGPTGPTSASAGTRPPAGGAGAPPPSGAGAGQDAGRRQGMGLNQALGIALQSVMAQGGGQSVRPAQGKIDCILVLLCMRVLFPSPFCRINVISQFHLWPIEASWFLHPTREVCEHGICAVASLFVPHVDSCMLCVEHATFFSGHFPAVLLTAILCG